MGCKGTGFFDKKKNDEKKTTGYVKLRQIIRNIVPPFWEFI